MLALMYMIIITRSTLRAIVMTVQTSDAKTRLAVRPWYVDVHNVSRRVEVSPLPPFASPPAVHHEEQSQRQERQTFDKRTQQIDLDNQGLGPHCAPRSCHVRRV